jgi:hypothetical protein
MQDDYYGRKKDTPGNKYDNKYDNKFESPLNK